MNNLISSLRLLLSTIPLMTISCASAIDKVACIEERAPLDVVRVDERNHRVFVVSNTLSATELAIYIDKLNFCFESSWPTDWSLSLFKEARFASYKDEEAIIPYHAKNSWANAYVAEYDKATGVLLEMPAVSAKKILEHSANEPVLPFIPK